MLRPSSPRAEQKNVEISNYISELWVKSRGKQNPLGVQKGQEVIWRRLYGSDLSPLWSNMLGGYK